MSSSLKTASNLSIMHIRHHFSLSLLPPIRIIHTNFATHHCKTHTKNSTPLTLPPPSDTAPHPPSTQPCGTPSSPNTNTRDPKTPAHTTPKAQTTKTPAAAQPPPQTTTAPQATHTADTARSSPADPQSPAAPPATSPLHL